MTWEDVLKRDDIIGGDLETREGDYIYRGPIGAIRADGDVVHFDSPWSARMPADMSSGWTVWHITSCYVNKDIAPTDIGDGRVHFQMPMLGFGVIFPKGGSKLDPARVEGLKIQGAGT